MSDLRTTLIKVIPSLSFILVCLSLSGQAEDHFPGYYVNETSALTVQILDSKEGQYAVLLTFQGVEYAGEATILLGLLHGTYIYQGNKIPFSISRILGQYFLTSEGYDLLLDKRPLPAEVQKNPGQNSNKQTTSTITQNSAKATGSLIRDDEAGYAVHLPAQWTAQRLDDGSYQALFDGQQSRIITISPHNYSDLNRLIKESSASIQQNGVQVTLVSPIQNWGTNGAMARYTGSAQGQKFSLQAIGLMSPHGGGLTLGIYELNTDQQISLELLQSMANTVKWSKPPVNQMAQTWQNRLTGKQLLYLYTGNGLSEKWSYDLCTNGSFQYVSNSTYLSGNFSETFSAAGQNTQGGHWRLTTKQSQPVLVLTNHSGEVFEFTLTTRSAGNEIGLNGKRYFIQPSEHCR